MDTQPLMDEVEAMDTQSSFGSQSERTNLRSLPDPRSPSSGIERTPIQVFMEDSTSEESFYSEASESIMEEVPVKETISEATETVEMISSVGLQKSEASAEILKENVKREGSDKFMETAENESAIDAELKERKLSKMEPENIPPVFAYPKYLIKKSLCTPINTKSGRLPLESVQNVMFPSTPPSRYAKQSPQFILRQKQWKHLQVERQKLGIHSNENDFPPLNDITSSAPGKLASKKQFGM